MAFQAEGAYYPLRRPILAPYVGLAIGHFATSRTDGLGSDVDGRTTSLVLGFHGRVWRGLGLRLEGVIRTDAGADDDQLRALLTYATRSPAPSSDVPAPAAAAVIYGMIPATGPWRLVEPGYGVKFMTPFSPQHSVALTLALFHWQIPHPTIPGAYTWDTRAVFVMPGWQWTRRGSVGQLHLQGGPALSIMLEGPDEGTRAGLQLELGASTHVGFVPLTASVGWLWLVRTTLPGEGTPGTDQRGLLLSAGVGF